MEGAPCYKPPDIASMCTVRCYNSIKAIFTHMSSNITLQLHTEVTAVKRNLIYLHSVTLICYVHHGTCPAATFVHIRIRGAV